MEKQTQITDERVDLEIDLDANGKLTCTVLITVFVQRRKS